LVDRQRSALARRSRHHGAPTRASRPRFALRRLRARRARENAALTNVGRRRPCNAREPAPSLPHASPTRADLPSRRMGRARRITGRIARRDRAARRLRVRDSTFGRRGLPARSQRGGVGTLPMDPPSDRQDEAIMIRRTSAFVPAAEVDPVARRLIPVRRRPQLSVTTRTRSRRASLGSSCPFYLPASSCRVHSPASPCVVGTRSWIGPASSRPSSVCVLSTMR